jgi:hypothetical protein
MKKKLLESILMISILSSYCLANSAFAGIINNNFGLVSAENVVTFDEFIIPVNTNITNQFNSLGVNFSPGLCYNFQASFFPTASLASFGCAPAGNNSIFFNDIVSSAAFALQSNPETTTFSSYLNGAFVESFSATTVLSFLPDLTNASNFYGFINSEFNEIRISNNSNVYQIDNIQFNSSKIPEPSTLAIFALGLMGLASRKFKK